MNDRQPIEDCISKSVKDVPSPIVSEVAREIELARLEAGLSVEELLKNLRAQRERYYREHYAADQSE